MENPKTLEMMWNDGTPLFNVTVTDYPFMADYVSNFNMIDTNIITLYGSRRFVLPKNKTFSDLFKGFLTMQKEPFTRFYNSISTDFSPIENYDKTSEITTSFTGSEKTTSNIGIQKITDIIGATGTDSTNSVAPYDYDTFSNMENNVTNSQEQTNTRNTDARKDDYERSFDDRKDVVQEHTHGNIGVTKSTELLEDYQNLQIRMNFIMQILSVFIQTYSY